MGFEDVVQLWEQESNYFGEVLVPVLLSRPAASVGASMEASFCGAGMKGEDQICTQGVASLLGRPCWEQQAADLGG